MKRANFEPWISKAKACAIIQELENNAINVLRMEHDFNQYWIEYEVRV